MVAGVMSVAGIGVVYVVTRVVRKKKWRGDEEVGKVWGGVAVNSAPSHFSLSVTSSTKTVRRSAGSM
jgi:hypothetical protein